MFTLVALLKQILRRGVGSELTGWNVEHIVVVVPRLKFMIIQNVVIVVRGEQSVIAHHLVAHWTRWACFGGVQSVRVDFVIDSERVFPFGTLRALELHIATVLRINEWRF